MRGLHFRGRLLIVVLVLLQYPVVLGGRAVGHRFLDGFYLGRLLEFALFVLGIDVFVDEGLNRKVQILLAFERLLQFFCCFHFRRFALVQGLELFGNVLDVEFGSLVFGRRNFEIVDLRVLRLLEGIDLLIQKVLHVGVMLLYVLQHHFKFVESLLISGRLTLHSVLTSRPLLQSSLFLIYSRELLEMVHVIGPPYLIAYLAIASDLFISQTH